VDLVLRNGVILGRNFLWKKITPYETRNMIFYMFVRNVCFYTLLYPKRNGKEVFCYKLYMYLFTYLLLRT